MSDERMPYSPPEAASPPTQRPGVRDPRGSLGAGIGLFFACLVGGGIVAAILRAVTVSAMPEWSYTTAMMVIPMLLPWVAALALGLWLAARGRTRTALGMLVGLGLLGALMLLLVAACFGIVAGMGGFN